MTKVAVIGNAGGGKSTTAVCYDDGLNPSPYRWG